jgi:hypothetical protein
MYANVRDLPACLRSVLSSVGYAKADVAISPRETVRLSDSGEDGCRSFSAIVNLETGESKLSWGSWGGANVFNPNNGVDLDDTAYPLPANGAVVQGRIGGGRPVHATIVVHPASLAPLLPAKQELTDKQAGILRCFQGLISSYRKEALARLGATDADIDALVARCLLKRNKAGATAITTEGKNAIPATVGFQSLI